MQQSGTEESVHSAFDEALARGDVDAAEAALKQLEESAPEDLRTKTAGARWLAARGELEEALAALKSLSEEHPQQGLPRAYLGALLVALGEREAAPALLEMALAQDGGDVPGARHALGIARLDEGRYADAITQFQAATERMAASAITFFHWGEAAEQLGDAAEATKAYGRCTEIDPHFLDAWIGWVRVLATTGQLPVAADVAARARAENPHEIEILRLAIQVDFDRGDLVQARAHLEAIPADSLTAQDVGNMAAIALGEERFEDALTLTDRAAQLDRTAWRPHFLAGLALEGSGAPRASARARYESAIEAGDPGGEAGTRLGFLLLTEEEPGAAERAIDVLAAAAQRNGRVSGTVLNMAIAYAKLGQNDPARMLAAEIIERDDASPHDKAEAQRLLGALGD